MAVASNALNRSQQTKDSTSSKKIVLGKKLSRYDTHDIGDEDKWKSNSRERVMSLNM